MVIVVIIILLHACMGNCNKRCMWYRSAKLLKHRLWRHGTPYRCMYYIELRWPVTVTYRKGGLQGLEPTHNSRIFLWLVKPHYVDLRKTIEPPPGNRFLRHCVIDCVIDHRPQTTDHRPQTQTGLLHTVSPMKSVFWILLYNWSIWESS